MIIYLLGLMDFMAGISLLLVKLKIDFFGVFFASYLILKGVLFLYDVVSILDILAGILLLFAINGYYGIITYLAVLWLLQKGIFSFLKIF